MRIMGFREFWVARVRLPGDILQRVESDPFVAELADSIRRVGLVQPPIIWALGRRRLIVLDGRERIAALIKLGIPTFKAICIEATPEEAYQLYIESHVHRKRDMTRQIEATAAPLRASHPYRVPPVELPEGMKRPPLPDQEQRGSPPEPELSIVELGMELTDEFRAELQKTHLELVRAVYYLACALGSLGRIKAKGLPMNELLLAGLERSLRATRDLLERAMPYSLCPWCKGVAGIACDMCVGSRWVPKEQYDVALPKLKDMEDKVVMVNGEAKRLRDVT